MSTPFADLGLQSPFIETLSQLNFATPTPIQLQAIPHVLNGDDVLAAAQTGTGKTAAFGLPILQQIFLNQQQQQVNNSDSGVTVSRTPKALILAPTRELAQQIFDNLIQYAQTTAIRIVAVYGGTSIRMQQQQLRQGCDVVIATPGRLLDHLFNGNVNIAQCSTFVLDEADRMLDMGFMPDMQRIMRRLPSKRQTLLFSATFDDRIKKLAHNLMQKPVLIDVSPEVTTAENVKQIIYPVDKKRKSELLAYLIGSRNWQQVLVFTKTKQATDALVKELKLDGIKAASIHGDKSQGARQRALDDFKAGTVRALIATDVAARGLDIQQLEQVVNYDLPYKAEDYVHRIGRTGRAGHSGFAASFMSHDEDYLLEAIETLLDTHLPQEWLQGFEPSLKSEIADDTDKAPARRRGRSADKRKMKAKLNIHAGRGKRK